MAKRVARAEWMGLRDALKRFVLAVEGHQGSGHIKPLHWYVGGRLVIEGGFHPDEITPRPPFAVETRGNLEVLTHAPERGGKGEQTVLGGLKTKDVDVVVNKSGIGPCIAISMKGTLKALRNLTNRMEEAAGDCTNLHIAYPALVYGFWHVIRANRPGPLPRNAPFLQGVGGEIDVADVALLADGQAANSIIRYHQAMTGLTGRTSIREDPSRYEAVALTLVDPDDERLGEVVASYPAQDSPLLLKDFFKRLYEQYDLRFVYQAPALEDRTRRLVWAPESPALADERLGDLEPRISG